MFDVVLYGVGFSRVETGNLAAGFILSAYLEDGFSVPSAHSMVDLVYPTLRLTTWCGVNRMMCFQHRYMRTI